MSNRGRQNVASYLALDLGVDWRRGADWFESCLLDYDVTSNWGNWAAAAGLTGGRVNHFNIAKQAGRGGEGELKEERSREGGQGLNYSKDYDLAGEYVKTWCPELRNVPAARVHEPWLMSKEEQERSGCRIGVDYPAPIPASKHGRPHAGAGGGGGGGGRPASGRPASDRPASGRPGPRSGGGGGGGGARGAKRSEFERYN
ncbi:Cryptochrome DASH, chloroplastic/mitochondrial, partial [Tetrabaena socialis]